MKVSWNDIGKSERPGEYMVESKCILVQKSDIAVWQDHPDVVFAVTPAIFRDGGIGNLLTDWDESAGTEH